MSSRNRPSEAAITAASTRSATASGGSPAQVSSRATSSPVAEDLLAPAPDLGDAVGVEDEHVAAVERDGDVGQQRLDVGAEQRAEAPDRGHAAVGVHDERQRMAAARQLEADPVAPDPQVGVTDGAEAALVAGLVAQRAVQQREDAGRADLVGRRGAHRVAGERGHRGGVRALALDVADQRRPRAVAGREQVVEVAAELDPLAGRPEADGGAQARDGRQAAGPQRALQRARDRALAVVELGVGDRDRGELGELGEDRLVARGELARRGCRSPRAPRAPCRGRSAAPAAARAAARRRRAAAGRWRSAAAGADRGRGSRPWRGRRG